MKGDGNLEHALQRALKILRISPRSEAEVRLRLKRLGFTPKAVDGTLKKLRSLNLVNDEAFARSWTRSRAEYRGYGPLRIESELGQKGIARSLIGEVVNETFSSEEVRERAKSLLEKRFKGKDLTDAKMLRRAIDFLLRRGYRHSVIAEVLNLGGEE